MGLSRLDNFLKSVRGTIIYVDPNSLDSTDSIENKGNSLTRPFKTIQRALLEAARFSYQIGFGNDRFNKTTIVLYPGDHIVDNRPGYIPTSTAGQFKKRSSDVVYDFTQFDSTTNFDLTTENNALYKLNSVRGGVIIPRGTSIVGMDLRKTKIRPKYVPNPDDVDGKNIERSCVFRVTGACYLWQFTILDADPYGTCYKDYTTNTFVPNFSHHKLAGFEYADGVNPVSIADDFITFPSDGRTDLDMYYAKVGIAYGPASGSSIDPDYPSSLIDIQPSVDEYRIVGSRGSTVGITSIKAGNGLSPTTTITLDFQQTTDQFSIDTPIQISGVGAVGYDGLYVVTNVLSSTQIQYQVQTAPATALPSVSGATLSISSDTVTSASPYIFNISLRSVWGMCGLLADGNNASGFKSMVVAQYTGIGLQKDEKAFLKYDATTGTYLDSASYTNLSSDSRAVFKPSYKNFHIKATNNAYLQLVSVFAIGFAEQFSVETGGDFSINSSNSNFGAKALTSSGFRPDAFPKDDIGYFTHIIPPKEIETTELSIDYLAIDVSKTISAATASRLYIYNETNLSSPPPGIVDGYRIGAKTNGLIYLQISQSGVTTEYSAFVTIPNNNVVLDQTVSEKTFTVGRSSAGINSISSNTITLTSSHSFINGESIRVISDTGSLPDGIIGNQVYYAITNGVNANQIKIAQTLNDATNTTASTINSNGGVLSIVSRVSDKNPGDIGHPVGYDTSNSNWYINVSTAATNNTIYPIITSLGTAGLGSATSRTYYKRKPDTRNIIDRTYRIRYVIPKDSTTTARPPLDGYIIQESNNTIGAGTTEIAKYFSPTTATLSNSTELRNPRFIANANWSGGTANVITELPHDLTIGSQVEVLNIISTGNTTGLANSAYNGKFYVTGISSSKHFSYGVTPDPGTFTNNTSVRDSSLPRFNRKRLSGTYYIYRTQEIKKYIQNVQDGIYYLTVVNSSNSPTVSPFTNLKFSQPIKNLYPQLNRDNPNSDPKATKSFASSDVIGQVVVDEVQNSVTKETIEKSLIDFNVGIGITNIVSSSSTSHTLYTSIDHGLSGITSVGIVTGGSGYLTGTYYNARLVGFSTGVNATARVTVGAAGTVTAVKIMDGGSAYGIGVTASLVGVGTTGSGASVNVLSIYNNVGDCLSVSGVSSARYSGYNTLYKITGITTSKQINVQSSESISNYSTTSIGSVVTANANILLTGKSLGISSFIFNSTTGVGIVTFTSAHGFLVNNKVRIVGFSSSIYDGDYIVKQVNSLTSININVGVATTALSMLTTSATTYTPSLSAYGGNVDINVETTSGRLIYEYGGITTTLGSALSATTTTFTITNAVAVGLNIGDYIQIDSEIFRISTTVTSNSITALRGLFGTVRQIHLFNSVVRKIKILPIELRRNSIIRASGHTFEYLGFGPGNYSTAFPERQDRALSNQEIILAQSTESDGGISIYTGMDDKGNFFTGNKKINSATGQEEVYDTPIPTITGEDLASGVNVGFDVISPLEISVNRSIKVEGGEKSNLLSEFGGPVLFNEKITSTSQKGIETKSLFIGGDQTISRKYTVGTSAPSAAGNIGDVVYNAIPSSADYLGWVYTSNNIWEKFGKIGTVSQNSVGVSSNNSFVGVSTLLNFATSGIALSTQYNSVTGITTLLFTGSGAQSTTIGVSTSTNNTLSGVGTQINFVGTNIDVSAKTDTVSGITTVNLVGVGTTSIYRGTKFIKTDGGSLGGISNILRADGTDTSLKSQDITNALGYTPQGSVSVGNYPEGNSIILDEISQQFDENTKEFGMMYGGIAHIPFGNSANLIVSLGGVIQKPGTDFSIKQQVIAVNPIQTTNTSTIVFTDAPTAGLTCFIISLGGQGNLLSDISWNAKGDLVVGTGADTADIFPVGSDDQVLTADSTTGTGVSWRGPYWYRTNGSNGGTYSLYTSSGEVTLGTSGPIAGYNAAQAGLSNNRYMTHNFGQYYNKLDSLGMTLMNSYNTATSDFSINLVKSRGTTIGGQDLTLNDDSLGLITFQGIGVSSPSTVIPIVAAAIRGAQDGDGQTERIPGRLMFYTTPVSPPGTGAVNCRERMRIDNNGDVGIGTTNPTEKLYVNGNILGTGNLNLTGGDISVTGGVDKIFVLGNTSIGGTTLLQTKNSSGDARNVQIDYDGVTIPGKLYLTGGGETTSSDMYVDGGADKNWGVYNQSDGGVISITVNAGSINQKSSTFNFNGDLSIPGTYFPNSDIKLKTNIQTIPNCLDKVLQLRGVEYDRIDMNGEHQIGVIAQEVEKIIPEVVKETNGTKGVAYGNLVAVLIEAIKELTERVELLENK